MPQFYTQYYTFGMEYLVNFRVTWTVHSSLQMSLMRYTRSAVILVYMPVLCTNQKHEVSPVLEADRVYGTMLLTSESAVTYEDTGMKSKISEQH